jgi:hypothetical protein
VIDAAPPGPARTSNARGRDGTPTTTPRDDVSYREIHGGLYGPDGQPHLEDIDRGDLGDCTFITALGTIAQSDPASIAPRVRPAGLRRQRRAHHRAGPDPAAVAARAREGPRAVPPRLPGARRRHRRRRHRQRLHEYLDQHIPVVLATGAPIRPNTADLVDPDPAAPRIIANHAYDVRAVDVAAQRITLFNPWGGAHDQPRPLTPEEVQRLFVDIIIGTAPSAATGDAATRTGATGTTTGAQPH